MKQNKDHYTESFYKSQMDESLASARIVAPLLLAHMPVKSVVDVGCGIGTWSSVFLQEGVTDVLGLDGEYVEKSRLLIPEENFKSCNLQEKIILDKKFDLAISLEVIEHLEMNQGKALVETLTTLAPVIMFSGAIPGQGGTNHINEQWQSHWAEEFSNHDYAVYDSIRPIIWGNENVYTCYKQNILLFVKKSFAESNPNIFFTNPIIEFKNLDVVHPEAWINRNAYSQINTKSIIRYYIQVVKNVIKNILKR